MEKSLGVANCMLRIAILDDNPLTNMKLQKLLYFAHGWNLAFYDEPLVDKTVQAWRYGPVIPDVYMKFRSYGTNIITRPYKGLRYSEQEEEYKVYEPSIKDRERTLQLLKRTWSAYGIYSGDELSQMTHVKDSPWKIMWTKYSGVLDIEIPDDLIKDYFKGLMKKGLMKNGK